jgi:hypothetical protein
MRITSWHVLSAQKPLFLCFLTDHTENTIPLFAGRCLQRPLYIPLSRVRLVATGLHATVLSEHFPGVSEVNNKQNCS